MSGRASDGDAPAERGQLSEVNYLGRRKQRRNHQLPFVLRKMLPIHFASTNSLKRVAIFVDVQNVYYTTRQAYGAHFDYNVFWRQVTADRHVVKAVAFAIDRGDEKQRQFQSILRGIGMEVKLKPFISRADGSSKGDWDVGITLDVMDCVATTDIVVLVSGDGDFDLLAQRLRDRHGIEVEVYGVAQLTADSLKRVATRFIPIDAKLLLARQ